uniref:Uncharacterized protein n=1 Tax=Glossina morsitans morsitans TaxID=37546 RepID=A0A1B0FQ51_GLOMM
MLMIGAESYLRKDNEDTGETPQISENEENTIYNSHAFQGPIQVYYTEEQCTQ